MCVSRVMWYVYVHELCLYCVRACAVFMLCVSCLVSVCVFFLKVGFIISYIYALWPSTVPKLTKTRFQPDGVHVGHEFRFKTNFKS